MMVQITRALNSLSWFLTCRVTVQRWASPAFCRGLPGEGHASRTESQLCDFLAVCSYYQLFIPRHPFLNSVRAVDDWECDMVNLTLAISEYGPGSHPGKPNLKQLWHLVELFQFPIRVLMSSLTHPTGAHLSSYSSQHLHHHRTLESSQAGHGWCLFSAAYFPSLGRVVVEKHVPPLYSKGTGCNLDKTFVVIDKILHVDIFLDYWGVLKIRLTYAPLNPIHPERSVSSILGLIQELGIINGVSHFF